MIDQFIIKSPLLSSQSSVVWVDFIWFIWISFLYVLPYLEFIIQYLLHRPIASKNVGL